MIDFQKLFGLAGSQNSERSELGSLFQELERLLSSYSQEEIEFIAGYSGLLGKVAYSDRKILLEEILEIKNILIEGSSISAEMYDAIIELVSKYTTELSGIEDQVYIQIINSRCSKEQKIEVLKGLFAVAAADQSVDMDEDRDISVIAKGLFVSHEDLVSIRKEYRDKLAVLKNKA